MNDLIRKIREYKKDIYYQNIIDKLSHSNDDLSKIIKQIQFQKEENKVTKYRVEKKFNGFHVSVHRKDKDIRIYSEQKKDISIAFPTLRNHILNLSDKNFIVDGEIVPYDERGNALGRNKLMKYMGAVKQNKEIDDSNVKLHIWDIVYYDNQCLVSLPLEIRRKYLEKLNFDKRITDTPGYVVKTRDEMENAILKCAKMPGSEGAVIKNMSAPYEFDEKSSAWIKYRHLISIDAVVIERYKKTAGYNYLVGIYVNKNELKQLDEKHIQDIGGKKILVLGKTFNTDKLVDVGDVVEISLEEVWRHVSENGIHYSIHKPRFLGKIPATKTSNIDDLEDIVTSVGAKIQEFENGFTVEFDLEAAKKTIKDWPQWVQSPLKAIMEKNAWMPFVIQHHYRGHALKEKENIPEKFLWNLKSVHSDLRCFLPRNYEKIKEGEVIKYEDAKKVDGLCFGITINSPPSVDKTDEVTNNAKNVLCEFKLPIPKGWLYVEGVARINDPGSTKNAPALFVIAAKGEYTCHGVEDHKIVLEFRCRKGRKNMAVFEQAEKDYIYIKNKFSNELKDLKGSFSFTINHIGDKHIILMNHIKEKGERVVTKETLNYIFEYTNNGYSRKQIAEELSVSPSTVYRYQKMLGLV